MRRRNALRETSGMCSPETKSQKPHASASAPLPVEPPDTVRGITARPEKKKSYEPPRACRRDRKKSFFWLKSTESLLVSASRLPSRILPQTDFGGAPVVADSGYNAPSFLNFGRALLISPSNEKKKHPAERAEASHNTLIASHAAAFSSQAGCSIDLQGRGGGGQHS